MFDKMRARKERFKKDLEKFEETHEKVRKAHQHVVKHKTIYTAAGTSAMTVLVMKRFGGGTPDVVQTFTNSTDNVATVINRSKNVDVVINYLNARNYNAKPIRCLETGEEWPSQVEAAEALSIAAWILSQHLSGKFENAKGLHFERISA